MAEYQMDAFERREMALDANAEWQAENILARVRAKRQKKNRYGGACPYR